MMNILLSAEEGGKKYSNTHRSNVLRSDELYDVLHGQMYPVSIYTICIAGCCDVHLDRYIDEVAIADD